jgi:zona occludens toxin
MIELITGLPGNGKTLMTIGQVKARALLENRPVFYNGIPELTIPGWELLDDPKQWATVPPRSIVLLDEGQKTFRNRSVGSAPPQFVTDLETHRHLGIDLVIITQHPSLIDPSVRRLAGKHQHVVRIWGMEASTVHTWAAVKDNCDKSRADSEKTKYVFDKSLYGLYKSAEVHTMKRSIPGRVKLLMALPLLLGALVYYVYGVVSKKSTPQPVTASVPAGGAGHQLAAYSPGAGPNRDKLPFDPLADAKEYAAMNTARVVGLPHTAPKYDSLTAPVRVPVPAMCVQIGMASRTGKAVNCKCYSQQGTPMPVEFNMCIDFARNGYFQDFDADRDAAARRDNAQSPPVVQAAAGQDFSSGPHVAVLPHEAVGMPEKHPIGK